jgi:hypothetical protein
MRSSCSSARVQVGERMVQSHCLRPVENFHQHSHPRQLELSLVLLSSSQELSPLVWQELWVRPWTSVHRR